MTLALQFESAGNVGDSFSALVAAVDAGIFTAPDLLDLVICVCPDSVKENSYYSFFGEFSILNRAVRNFIS